MFFVAVAQSEEIDTEPLLQDLEQQCSAQLAGRIPQAAIVFAAIDVEHEALLADLTARWPGLELVGCTTTQDNVARVISSLRRVDGVQHVSLSSSAKGDSEGDSGASTSTSGDDCRHGSAHFPQFSMTLFFEAPSTGQASAQGTTP